MSKYTLNTVGSIALNSTSATNTINGNNATIMSAFDNTLSRDGTQPNVMNANIDMNSNRIINLPQGVSQDEPLRVQDLDEFVNGGVTFHSLPTGGTTGQVLKKNSNVDFDASWKTDYVTIVTDYGADPTGVLDSAPAFRAAVAACPNGGTIRVPSGSYLFNSTVNNSCIEINNKSVAIIGDGYRVLYTGSSTWTAYGTVFRMGPNILNTQDFIHCTVPSTGTSIDFGGLHFSNFCLTTTSPIYAGAQGRHGFFFDTLNNDNCSFENVLIEHCFIDNMAGGYSICSKSNVTNTIGGLVLSTFQHNVLMSIRLENTADGVLIHQNTFGQNAINDSRNQGIYISCVAGATTNKILNNYFLNFNGMVVIDACPAVVIENNIFEQSAANTYGRMVDINGATATVTGAVIHGNRFSNATANSIIPLRINNAQNCNVESNWFYQGLVSQFITVTNLSQGAVIGPGNYYQDTSGYKVNGNILDNGAFTRYETPLYVQMADTNVPGTPATGIAYGWYDATDRRWHDINQNGTIGTTAVAKSATANQFLTSMSTAGVFTSAQPTASNISGLAPSATTDTTNASNITSGTLGAGRMPAFSGDGSTSAGSTALTVTGINGINQNSAWSTYTPTVSSQTGTITAATISTSGRYKVLGKTIFVQFTITLTNVGTGTPGGGLQISAPFAASGAAANVGSCFEAAATGKSGACVILASGSTFSSRPADGTSTWFVNGYVVDGTITYELP